MMSMFSAPKRFLRKFARAEDGTGTLEFVIVFPVIFSLFLMSLEISILTLRQVMLERAVELAVRDVRIGKIPDPSHAQLIEAICDRASAMPKCRQDLQLEMIIEDVYAWGGGVNGPVRCIDRAEDVQPLVQFVNGGNNNLMILQACMLFDPMFSSIGVGAVIPKVSGNAYGLIAKSAFVMEPFK